MSDTRKWIIVGCAALLVCVVCVAVIAGGVYFWPQIQQTFSVPQGAPAYTLGDMQGLIQRLNGTPCQENPDFTCVTLSVPLDHFDASNTQTLNVVFAIHLAAGERRGMYVQAFPGGPGGEGVSTGRLDFFDDKILERYDIVYFDQRGLGLSDPLQCPNALATYFGTSPSYHDTDSVEGLDTPAEQQQATDEVRTFVEDCVKEIGIAPEDFRFYDTKQVAEDIESFRQAVGDDKFYLYGVSYGTEVAQTYAAAHADRLAGLVLDGTVDMTLDGVELAHAQDKAFNKVLLATLAECKKSTECMADFGGDDPQTVYDDLAASLSKNPQSYEFPLPDGTTVTHLMTFGKLEAATSYALYSLGTRMMYMRALAAAHQGDLVPLARIYYAEQDFDPATEKYVGDPTFSFTAYYFVNCTDENFFTGTLEERLAKIFQDGQSSNGTIPRLDGSVYTGLVCAFWPDAPTQEVRAEPLRAEGVPTFVLNATLDPATPFEEGQAVFQRLADGYHLYVEGGQHSIFGYKETCPDNIITDFLVYGTLPSQRETQCTWDSPVMWSYISPAPAEASQFTDLLLDVFRTDVDILMMPEHFLNSDKGKEITVACPYGGSFAFTLGEQTETLTFANCEFSKGFAMTGTGSLDIKSGTRTYEFTVSGYKDGSLTYTYDGDRGSISLTGTYGGEAINLSR